MLYFARVLVNLDVKMTGPGVLVVELEGDTVVEVEVQYENVPRSKCLSASHLSRKWPFSAAKPPLLKTPTLSPQPQTVPVTSTDTEPRDNSPLVQVRPA